MNIKPRGDRTWLWVVLVFVVFWIFYLARFGPRNQGGSASSERKTADYAWKVEDLAGSPVTLERYRGKPLFLNLWATWCRPCVAEMPSISRLATNPRLKDVAVVCVSLDDDLEPVRKFVQEKKLNVTVFRSNGTIPDVFNTDAIPATFLIAPDGKIVEREIGATDWDKPAVVEKLEGLSRTQ